MSKQAFENIGLYAVVALSVSVWLAAHITTFSRQRWSLAVVLRCLMPVIVLACGFGISLNNLVDAGYKDFMPKCAASSDPGWILGYLDDGASASTVDRKGNSVLMIAVCNDNIEIVRILLKYGADVNYAAPDGTTAQTISASRVAKKEKNELVKAKRREIAAMLGSSAK